MNTNPKTDTLVLDASAEVAKPNTPETTTPKSAYYGPPLIDSDGKVRVSLEFPVNVKKLSLGYDTLETVTLRPITVRDRRLSIKSAGADADDMDREIGLLSIITNLPEEAINLIDHRDYGRVTQGMGKLFFSRPILPSS